MRNQAKIIQSMTDVELLLNVYITQFIFVVMGIVLSFFVFEEWSEFFTLFQWQPFHIFVVGGLVAFLVIALQLGLEKLLPDHLLDDGGINERLFKKRSIIHILFLAFVISISEELLFRGIVQTQFGIILASLLFAIIHVRYLRNWVLFLLVISVSFLLGSLYEMTGNLLVPIYTHFLIDAVLGIILRSRININEV